MAQREATSLVQTGTWDELKLSPATLMKMVIEGKAKIIGKNSRGSFIYEIRHARERE